MILKTRIFDLCDENYGSLPVLAHAMGISVSQIYRVRQGKRRINQKFLVGAIRAFPQYKLGDLFYFVPASLTDGKYSINKQQSKKEEAGITSHR